MKALYERSYLVRRVQRYIVEIEDPDNFDFGDVFHSGDINGDFDQYVCDKGRLDADYTEAVDDDDLDYGFTKVEPELLIGDDTDKYVIDLPRSRVLIVVPELRRTGAPGDPDLYAYRLVLGLRTENSVITMGDIRLNELDVEPATMIGAAIMYIARHDALPDYGDIDPEMFYPGD